jgi:hypothetical protein
VEEGRRILDCRIPLVGWNCPSRAAVAVASSVLTLGVVLILR